MKSKHKFYKPYFFVVEFLFFIKIKFRFHIKTFKIQHKKIQNLTLKFQDCFGEYWASNMYFIACRINIKMKFYFFHFQL